MEKKNQKLLIVVGVLLLFGGVSLAYFVSKILTNGNGGNISVTTAVINGATVNVEGVLSFEDLDILPGHKSVSSIKVTATGNNELIPYNLIWQGTNTLTTPLEFTIYKTSERIEVKATCEDKSKMIGAAKAIYEECNISNLDRLGTEIATGVINKNDAKVTLAKDEFITAVNNGISYYYYVILEYPNLDEPQNYDLEGVIEGEVTVEESNIKPDINILAAYVVQEDGTYKEVEDIPQTGYHLNSAKSTCSNGATPTGNVPNVTVNNLTKSGTSCYLYFDRKKESQELPSEDRLTNFGITNIKESLATFSGPATTDEGVFKAEDGMYGGHSYYWRGAATTNHVIFANKCWRIIRINGDGTIRIIYNGSPSNGTCAGNGSNVGSLAAISQRYIPSDRSDDNTSFSMVGYTFSGSSQRPTDNSTGTASNLKIQTDYWYNNNIGNNTDYDSHVADGKFCNDRSTKGGNWYTSGYSGNEHGAVERVKSGKVTLSCPDGDIYTLKVGAISVDEVVYAGGWNEDNTSYYLYNGQCYWTMTPWGSRPSGGTAPGNAWVYIVLETGSLDGYHIRQGYGIRPVINLKSNVVISSGNGTQNSPFIVAD